MKLCVGEKVLLNTAVGMYWTEIIEIVWAYNAAFELCEWYVHRPTQRCSDSGVLLPKKSRFNEYMANQLVMKIKSTEVC